MADPAPGILANPHEENLRYFDVVMEGPSSTPFAGNDLHQGLSLNGLIDFDYIRNIDWPKNLRKIRDLKLIINKEDRSSWSYFFLNHILWNLQKFDS